VALKEVIACIAPFLTASHEKKIWENIEAAGNVKDNMLACWSNNLSGFCVPAPLLCAPNPKTAVKVMLASPVIPKRERHWRKWRLWFRAFVWSFQQQIIGNMCPTTWSP
jgi:hypothetical protein